MKNTETWSTPIHQGWEGEEELANKNEKEENQENIVHGSQIKEVLQCQTLLQGWENSDSRLMIDLPKLRSLKTLATVFSVEYRDKRLMEVH